MLVLVSPHGAVVLLVKPSWRSTRLVLARMAASVLVAESVAVGILLAVPTLKKAEASGRAGILTKCKECGPLCPEDDTTCDCNSEKI